MSRLQYLDYVVANGRLPQAMAGLVWLVIVLARLWV